jgi:hypothetical protein
MRIAPPGALEQGISRTLSVSPFTVQDCVKKIFAKLSVGSRGGVDFEVVLRLLHAPPQRGATAREFGLVRHPPRVGARPRSGARKTTGGAKG